MVKLLEKDNRKNTIIAALAFLLGAWLVAWLRLRNIDIMMGPYIFPDQLGYFTHAAVLNGLPWYQTTDSWYSYVVSIPIAFIMKLTHNMASIYKMSVYLNTMLSLVGYVLGYILVRLLAPSIRREVACAISAISSCCSAYVFQAQIVWAETYVYTGFMLVLVLALWYAKKPTVIRVSFLSLAVSLLFVTHNRTIVVIAALLAMVFFTAFADKKWLRQALHIIIVLAMILCVYKANARIKIWFQDREGFFTAQTTEWIEANSTFVLTEAVSRDVRPDFGGFDRDSIDQPVVHEFKEKNSENNLSGRLGNITLALNDSNAFFGMIKSALGCYWYLLASTALLAGFGVFYLIKRISPFSVFALLCFIATIAETGYNAMWYPAYMTNTIGNIQWEMLFYGRYVEMLTMPLIIFGLIEVYESIDKKYIKLELGVNVLIYILVSVLVVIESVAIEGTLNNVCVPGVCGLLLKSVYFACIVPLIIGIIVYGLIKASLIRERLYQSIIGLTAAFILSGFFFYNLKSVEVFNNDDQIAINGYNELAEVLQNNTDVLAVIDSANVLKDRYYRLRTQAIDNRISYDSVGYWENDCDMIYITSEDNVENFLSEHQEDELYVLDYGNYPMIIRGSELASRLMDEGYELEN